MDLSWVRHLAASGCKKNGGRSLMRSGACACYFSRLLLIFHLLLSKYAIQLYGWARCYLIVCFWFALNGGLFFQVLRSWRSRSSDKWVRVPALFSPHNNGWNSTFPAIWSCDTIGSRRKEGEEKCTKTNVRFERFIAFGHSSAAEAEKKCEEVMLNRWVDALKTTHSQAGRT